MSESTTIICDMHGIVLMFFTKSLHALLLHKCVVTSRKLNVGPSARCSSLCSSTFVKTFDTHRFGHNRFRLHKIAARADNFVVDTVHHKINTPLFSFVDICLQ